MKQDKGDRLSRLLDRAPGGTAPEDRAAALIRGLQPCDEPNASQLARIEEGIRARSSHRARPSLAFRVAVAGLVIFTGAATVKAYELARRAGWLDRIHRAVLPPDEPTRAQPPRRSPRATSSAPVKPAATADPPVLVQETVTPPSTPDLVHALEAHVATSEPARRQVRPLRRMAAIEAPAYVPSPTAARPASIEPPPPLPASAQTAHALPAGVSPSAPSPEIHALDRAIALLRRDHDAGAALAALDTYLDRYPHGVLQREARLARLDALLVLKRTDEALAVLETLPLDNRRRSTEHQVMRAELRARTDCSRAEEDFNVALTHSPDAALLERILYGRGACRAKMGKASGAAEDLQHYLERFPSGAHATWARQWLDTINRPPLKGG